MPLRPFPVQGFDSGRAPPARQGAQAQTSVIPPAVQWDEPLARQIRTPYSAPLGSCVQPAAGLPRARPPRTPVRGHRRPSHVVGRRRPSLTATCRRRACSGRSSLAKRPCRAIKWLSTRMLRTGCRRHLPERRALNALCLDQVREHQEICAADARRSGHKYLRLRSMDAPVDRRTGRTLRPARS